MTNLMQNNLEMFVWDVGHGLSISLITPYIGYINGSLIGRRRVIQIDAGSNIENGFSPVKKLVENGFSIIDVLSISHPDKDHIDDLPMIENFINMEKLKVFTILRNKTIPQSVISDDPGEETQPKASYRNFDTNYKVPASGTNILERGNYGGIDFNVSYISYVQDMDINDASVILTVKYGQTQLIFPGDISSKGVLSLIKEGRLPQKNEFVTRILIAPHHGRESADPKELLQYYQPHLVIASAKEEDEDTDPIYSNSPNILGYNIGRQTHRLLSTKGKLIYGAFGNSFHYIERR